MVLQDLVVCEECGGKICPHFASAWQRPLQPAKRCDVTACRLALLKFESLPKKVLKDRQVRNVKVSLEFQAGRVCSAILEIFEILLVVR